jgi:chaperonin GroEL
VRLTAGVGRKLRKGSSAYHFTGTNARAGHEGSIVVQRVKEMNDEEGFNAQTERYENLVQAGVLDPTKVVRSALQNATSIASLLLTTEAVISQIPERHQHAPMPSGGMGGGMY